MPFNQLCTIMNHLLFTFSTA